MPDFKTLGAFIGWVGGALAGITALLYAIGFVATLYHLNMMGMNTEFVSRDGFVYVGRGAIALNKAFLFIFIGAAFAGLIQWAFGGAMRLAARAGGALRRGRTGKAFTIGDVTTSGLHLALTLALLVYALSAFIQTPATAHGLLFAGRVCPDHAIRLVCDTAAANLSFGWMSVFAGAVLILCWVGAARVVGDGLNRLILLAGYAVTALFVVFFMIPVGYGLLIVHEDMPTVTLLPADTQRFAADGNARQLLRQDSSGTLLWVARTRELQWIAPGELKALRLNHDPPAPPAAAGQPGVKP